MQSIKETSLLKLENTDNLKEYPLRILFLNDQGYDTGALLWDMLSEFCKDAIPKIFRRQLGDTSHLYTNRHGIVSYTGKDYIT